MPRRNRASRAGPRLEGRRLAQAKAAEMGSAIRTARKRRRWTQASLGRKVDLAQSRIAQLERSPSPGTSIEIWLALATALGLPLRIDVGRDPVQEPDDAGHLRIQELMLRLARETGRARMFELPTRPVEPTRSIDVCTRDQPQRVLFIEECWNTFGNINASIRSTRRKMAEAEQLAVAVGGADGAYRVAAVWIVRDTRRNRAILQQYPEVFSAAFVGPSRQWVRALTRANEAPPVELGLVWCDRNASRLFSWRKP